MFLQVETITGMMKAAEGQSFSVYLLVCFLGFALLGLAALYRQNCKLVDKYMDSQKGYTDVLTAIQNNQTEKLQELIIRSTLNNNHQ